PLVHERLGRTEKGIVVQWFAGWILRFHCDLAVTGCASDAEVDYRNFSLCRASASSRDLAGKSLALQIGREGLDRHCRTESSPVLPACNSNGIFVFRTS